MNQYKDVVQIAPELHEVVFENSKVRIIKATLPPSTKLPLHVHPAHIFIVIKGSKVRVKGADDSREIDVSDGTVGEGDTNPHTVENIGNSAVEEYLIEFKNAG